MSKNSLRAGTSPFAHLLSLATGGRAGGRTGSRAEEPADRNEEDDEARKARRAEEDQTRDEENARRAEEDQRREEEDARRAEEDGGGAPPEDKTDDKAKKAEEEDDAAESRAEDDQDDADMASARSEGFTAAQVRGRRIFSSAAAGKRPDIAAHLAFNDSRPSAEAIAFLELAANGVAPEAGTRLGRRMARVVIPNPGTGEAADGKTGGASFGELAKRAAQKAGILPID